MEPIVKLPGPAEKIIERNGRLFAEVKDVLYEIFPDGSTNEVLRSELSA